MIFLFRRINSHGSTDKSGDCSASSIRNQAATTEIRPAVRDRGLFLITISTSWPSAVRNVISRHGEAVELVVGQRRDLRQSMPSFSAAADEVAIESTS
jgi:hypothetical protein